MKITPEIEAVARAIYEKRNGAGVTHFSRLPNKHREPYLLDAIEAIRALRDPTYDQINAGADIIIASGGYNYSITEPVYTAMINAALGGGRMTDIVKAKASWYAVKMFIESLEDQLDIDLDTTEIAVRYKATGDVLATISINTAISEINAYFDSVSGENE